MANDHYLTCALARAKANGIDIDDSSAVIAYLEQSYEIQCEKIKQLTACIKERYFERINGGELTTIENLPKLDLINLIGDLIKALSENGYNNISINAYKTNGSEGE